MARQAALAYGREDRGHRISNLGGARLPMKAWSGDLDGMMGERAVRKQRIQ